MAGGDWVRLYRAMLDHPVMQDDFLCRLWNWCLLKANYKPARWRDTVIHPGQFVTGRNSAAEELKCTPSRWYRGIMRLQELGCLVIEANSNWTTLTIVNWRTYQSGDMSERTANEQPANTSKERKKESPIGDSKPSASERRISLPPSINTPEFRDAWSDWIAHRKEIKKPLTPTQATALVKKFSRWGPERSIAAMVYTIEKGWQGLKEPNDDERRTGDTRSGGKGTGGTMFAREQASQDQQLGTIQGWLEKRSVDDSVQQAGLRPVDGLPHSDETHRLADGDSA